MRSPVRLTMRPWWMAMVGSIRSLRSARSRARIGPRRLRQAANSRRRGTPRSLRVPGVAHGATPPRPCQPFRVVRAKPLGGMAKAREECRCSAWAWLHIHAAPERTWKQGVQVLRVDWPVYPRRAEHNTVAEGGNRRWGETARRAGRGSTRRPPGEGISGD
jgi:hypothetical protein